ncbi:Tn3 family transposase [Streptomyces sp. NPDC059010]|uniref:Tn3 family transposase n=1 Tax=Streptomyces sp. NPDC059010 TaxID=3346695 RepID=UPI00368BE54C
MVRREVLAVPGEGDGARPNWNNANTVLHYGKDGALTGPDKEHAETSMLALHLLQSALVHVNTLLLQQVLAEPSWAKKLSAEDRRGLTALFWSNIKPYGTLHPCDASPVDSRRPAMSATHGDCSAATSGSTT